jgi:hypothetical protein
MTRLTRRAYAFLVLAALAGACSESSSTAPRSAPKPGSPSVQATSPSGTRTTPPAPAPPRMIAFDSYMEHRNGGFDGTRLVRIDPRTLARSSGPELRLRNAGSAWIFGPDHRALAVGGVNFGELMTVDVPSWSTHAFRVVRAGDYSPEVIPVSWPRDDLLIAYAQSFAAHELLPGSVLVADPMTGQVTSRTRLHGSVLTATRTANGGAALLVCPVRRVGSTRLVLVDPAGKTRTVDLDQVHGGYADSGSPGVSMSRRPALLARGNHVYVIGAQDPVAEVDVRRAAVAYHDIPGFMTTALPGSDYQVSGSGGALSQLWRDAHWIVGGRALVTGSESYPVGDGTYMHGFSRAANIVDLVHWKVDTVLPNVESNSETARGLIVANIYGPNRQVLRPDGTLLFARHGPRFWTLAGARLIEAGTNGRKAVELDLHTGRVIRRLPRLATWPLAVTAWPVHRADAAAHQLEE